LIVACEHYNEHFGQWPRGIWLPECAYYQGLERMIADAGLRYMITDAHGLLYAKPRPRYGMYAPIFTETGVAVFGRDHESSQQVWSAEVGYPGDPVYREFYKDLGYEADYEYIKPYIMPNGQRKNTGIKYHRITGRNLDLGQKQLYDPYWAREKAAEHAGNFMFNRQRQIEYLYSVMGRPPLVVAPYDAELFGPLVVRGPLVFGFSHPQELLRPKHLPHDSPGGVPAGEPHPAGVQTCPVQLGGARLPRVLAQPHQRLDLPPPAQGHRADDRAEPSRACR
jgi:1,4-alpha-glucan branching enzyme